ncbi:hypothetical protein V8E55_004977 [Tylopilus felleus]
MTHWKAYRLEYVERIRPSRMKVPSSSSRRLHWDTSTRRDVVYCCGLFLKIFFFRSDAFCAIMIRPEWTPTSKRRSSGTSPPRSLSRLVKRTLESIKLYPRELGILQASGSQRVTKATFFLGLPRGTCDFKASWSHWSPTRVSLWKPAAVLMVFSILLKTLERLSSLQQDPTRFAEREKKGDELFVGAFVLSSVQRCRRRTPIAVPAGAYRRCVDETRRVCVRGRTVDRWHLSRRQLRSHFVAPRTCIATHTLVGSRS